MTGLATGLDTYLSSFSDLEKQRPHSWVHEIRKAAMERFLTSGFPTTQDEEWRFTSVAAIPKHPFKPAAAAGAVALEHPLADLDPPRLVFVNGYFQDELSVLPRGIDVANLAAVIEGEHAVVRQHLTRYARYKDHAFVALNTAFLEDGAFIGIPKGTVLEKPLHVVFVTAHSGQPAVSHPRNLIVVGRDAQVSVVETYLGLSNEPYFTNAVTEIVAGENAIVEHYKLQQEQEQAFHIATLQIYQERASSFTSHSISLGGGLVRNDVNVVLDGEGAESTLNGLYIGKGAQHVDNHTTIDHARPHCNSREIYKGILDGKASAVFNGKIVVRKGAQKTDAKQTNKNLLLSEDATINTKPQLEIYADDVKCTHGATIGQLGEELVFYLRSRGISHEAARALLTYAFAKDVTDKMKVEPIRAKLDELLLTWLKRC